MSNNLPQYKISINSDLAEDGERMGISQIAYTATPAIITRGLAFDEQIIKKMKYADTLKYRLAAPILIPDLPIYREDDELGQYEVIFDRETIEQLYSDFMLNKGQAAFNLDHNTKLEAPSYILESWLTGPSATDPSFTKYGIELPEGSVFVVSQFTDKEYFQKEIIDKDRLGYSIEGFLGLALNTITKQLKQNKMTKQKFEMAKLEDGTQIWISKMEVGADVFIIDENMDKAPIFDGEHILTSGETVVTVDGKITEIKPKSEEELSTEEVVLADVPVEEVPVVEEVTVEAPVATADEAAILAVVQPKLDELYKLIADLKTMVEADAVEDVVEQQMKDIKSTVSLSRLFKK